MAHFAQIEDGLVTQVIVVANEVLQDSQGNEIEQQGIDFCSELLGGTWIQTSYNNNLRKNYAGRDMTYDLTRDAFIPPKPYPSWTLIEDTCLWEAPTAYPAGDGMYSWDEDTTSWKETQF